MKKRISAGMILVIALMLVGTVALASGLGLFGQMSQDERADKRLSQMENAAENVAVTYATDDGIAVSIEQAYYEGNRVFISYRMTGNIYSVELHEGAPEAKDDWDIEMPDTLCRDCWGSENPTFKSVTDFLTGEGQRWAEAKSASLHDGLSLEDDTYLNIIGGDEYYQEDGSVIGWKECEIPEDLTADILTFKAQLFRSESIYFQDGATFKWRGTHYGGTEDIPFTLKQNTEFQQVSGSYTSDLYQAEASFSIGQIDMKGTIRTACPDEWVKYYDWDDPANWDENSDAADAIDHIDAWELYCGDELIHGELSLWLDDSHSLWMEREFPRQEDISSLKLIPSYSISGPHFDEQIKLTADK